MLQGLFFVSGRAIRGFSTSAIFALRGVASPLACTRLASYRRPSASAATIPLAKRASRAAASPIKSARSLFYFARSLFYFARSLFYFARSLLYFARSLLYFARSLLYFARSLFYFARSLLYCARSLL